MKFLKLSGLFPALPSELMRRLDENFTNIENDEKLVSTNLNGYTLKGSDTVISLQVNATASALTIYLPDQPNGNRRRTITKTDSSGNAVTVNGNGNLINGSATYSLPNQYNSVTVEPTGTDWLIVAAYP